MITLCHLRPAAMFRGQFERWLEEVHEQPQCGVDTSKTRLVTELGADAAADFVAEAKELVGGKGCELILGEWWRYFQQELGSAGAIWAHRRIWAGVE